MLSFPMIVPTQLQYRDSALLPSLVQIYNTSDGLRYDGGEDGLLRSAKANVLFTHEIFEEFLNQFYNGRISMKGWFKSKMRVFKATAEEMLERYPGLVLPVLPLSRECNLEVLSAPRILHSVLADSQNHPVVGFLSKRKL